MSTLSLPMGLQPGRPTLAHLNHPNYSWAVNPTDVTRVKGTLHFEVYNGHPAVHNLGDDEHAGTEELWDLALALRLGSLGRELVYGVASDDTHNYHSDNREGATAYRGWVMVRATELTADSIVQAMQRGDYYGSTGVVLSDVVATDDGLTLKIDAAEGVAYRTEFIGTRAASGRVGLGEVGEARLVVDDRPIRPVYAFAGDELYVRARVVSDAPMKNPAPEDTVQRAWTQPVVPSAKDGVGR